MNDNKFMDEARQMVIYCFKELEYENINLELAEMLATKLSLWMDIAAQNGRDTEYYRNLLVQCGEIIGEEAYISDDGSVQDDVLCAKIPELIKNLYDRLDIKWEINQKEVR